MTEQTLSEVGPRLEELLRCVPDGALAGKLKQVYGAAHRAASRLGERELLAYDVAVAGESPDLGLWEQMAPLIRDTLEDVNGLLAVIREHFPPGETTEESEAGVAALQQARDAAELLSGWVQQLGQGVARLGEVVRKPAVVADQWALLEEVQRSRGRLREQIGCLVYESASAFGPVAPQEVVPGYEASVRASVLLRAITADLARIVAVRAQKVRGAPPEDLLWQARHLEWELEAFSRTEAWRVMRAQDKRQLLRVRERLSQLTRQERVGREELREVVARLEQVVRELAQVGRRQVLIAHDREVWAACMGRLQRAIELAEVEPASAATLLAEAITSAQALYGKCAELDGFLRRARKTPQGQLRGAELRSSLVSFHGLLSKLEVV